MSSLKLIAPIDLSLGRLSLAGRGSRRGPEKWEWTATPARRECEAEGVEPGVYTAFVEPLGQAALSFVFEFRPGEVRPIELPPITVLSNQAQSVSEDLVRAIEAEQGPSDLEPLTLEAVPSSSTEVPAEAEKLINVGLSEDHSPKKVGGWSPYRFADDVRSELIDGRLELVIPRPTDELPGAASGGRVRLSVALENTRVERVMVPLYRGGTRMLVQASELSSEDMELLVVPVDPVRRALTQALRAGFVTEAQAIAADLQQVKRDQLVGGDPWIETVLALLGIRFPGVFPHSAVCLPSETIEKYSWIPDIHIVAAHRQLLGAGDDQAKRARAAEKAARCFKRARTLGAPYYTYANQLAAEMLGSLLELGINDEVTNLIRFEHDKWLGNAPLQRSAGASFSWVMVDRRVRASRQASSATSGRLNPRHASIVFRARLCAGQLRPTGLSKRRPATHTGKASTKRSPSPWMATADQPNIMQMTPSHLHVPRDPPALAHRSVRRDDPQYKRVGGKRSAGGYVLSATFEHGGDDWTRILLEVRDETSQRDTGKTVEFFLHHTFEPNRIQATFRGGKATLSISAWGGFTVGAWILPDGVELELDLASVEGAPDRIQQD